MSSFFRKLSWLGRRRQKEAELREELEFHLQEEAQERRADGLSGEEAGHAARRDLGNYMLVQEDTRAAWGWTLLEQFFQDVRYASRSLRKSPLFTVVAVLTLALGIGANTAIFSLMDQVLLQLLPVKHPEQLVLVAERGTRFGGSWGDNDISYPMYRDFRDGNQVFSGMFCRFPTSVSLGYGDRTERVGGELVSGSYFPVLGVTAAIGRTLTPDDDRVPGGHPVAMLSYSFWQNRFSSDPSIVGKQIVANGYTLTVIGVSQAGFDGVELGYKSRVFVPMMMKAQMTPRSGGPSGGLEDRSLHWVTAFGRLKPGIGIAQANASLRPLMHSILEVEVQEPTLQHYSDYDRAQFVKHPVELLPGSQGWSGLRERMQTPLWVLAALSGAVLLLACANLANLLLARSTTRDREMAVRLAIGAGRRRIIRLLLVESLLLSVIGTVVGLGLAFLADRVLLTTYFSADSASDFPISPVPDARVLVFALGTMLLTALVFGLAPAIQSSQANIAPTLKDRAGSAAGRKQTFFRKLLVSGQMALALLLLIGASLFLRTLANLENAGPGFSTEHLLTFRVDPSLNGYTDERTKNFFRRLTDDLQTLPGVSSVGLSTMPFLQGYGWSNPVIAEGYATDPGQEPPATLNEISPNLFKTLDVPILAGRDITPFETRPVALINETFARKYFAGRNPIGLHIGLVNEQSAQQDVPNLEVVGVVKDLKFKNLRDPAPVQAYYPYWQGVKFRFMTFYLRTRSDPRQVMETVRDQVRQLDPNLPVVDMRTLDEQVGLSLKTERLVASLSAVFGALATALAVIGLYGVMAYSVARRRREIGIRVALGALQSGVLWMVMRQVVLLSGVGLAVGGLLAFALSSLIRSQLYGLQPHDPFTYLSAAGVLASAACVAGFIPSWRASRVDPMNALRHE
ncbi:MAG TPA: ABC transporter permease [Candidatus Acidoferrum sp.]|nr:ABC transporter permease [Candidatus Acidoferrum sp.]